MNYKLNLNCRKGGEREKQKMTKKEILQAVEGLRKNKTGCIAPTAGTGGDWKNSAAWL